MAEKEENKLYFTDEKSKSQRFSEFLRRLQHAFFDIFYVQYKSSSMQVRQYSKQRQKLYHTCNMILYSLQLISLVFPPHVSDWSSFKLFSDIVSIARVDFLLVKLNLGMPCYFIALSLTLIPFFSLVLLFIKSVKKLAFDIQNYKLTLTAGLSFIKNLSFIPFLCIFTAVQKFEIIGLVEEYGNSGSITLPIPYLGTCSIAFLVILIFLALIENTFQYQQFLTKSSSFIFSRAHSKIETLKLLLSTSLVFSHFYLQDIQNTIHLLIAFLIGLSLWGLYSYYLPFYQVFANFTHSSAFLLLMWVSLVELFSKVLANSTMIFVLIVFVSPCLLVIQWDILNRRKEYIAREFNKKIISLDNIYKCELLIRNYSEELIKVSKEEGKENEKIKLQNEIFMVFKYMKKRFKPSNMLAVWEFIFAFTLLKDEGLARVKLSGTASMWDIEGSFLYYKYCRLIDDFSNNYLEDVDFVKFRQIYEQATKQDKKTCQLQFEFWKELSSEKPNVGNLEKIAYKLHDNLKKCKKALKKVTSQYPNNELALKLYGTFLLEVYNDNIKGNELLSKAEHEKKQQEMRTVGNYEKFNYFDDNNGIIIISGERDNLGNISSINRPASEILRISENFAISMNISNFIPPPMNITRIHNKALAKFLINSQTTSVNLPFLNYFIDSLGFLVEVYLQVRCVALNDCPFFLAGVKKSHLPREIILYDGDTILAGTKGFAILVGYSDTETNLKGCQLSAVIKEINKFMKNQNTSDVFKYMIPQTVNYVSMKFVDIKINSFIFKLIFASDNPEEISTWNTQQAKSFSDLNELKSLPTSKPVVIGSLKRGILKMSNTKKNLNVKFDIEPHYFYINETDFKPGKSPVGKFKDAATVKNPAKGKTHESLGEGEKDEPENKVEVGEIMDLKDLQSSMLRKKDEENEEANGEDEELKVKRSGASVASSAQSSNASFTSSLEAQSLLSGVTSSMKSFKIAFFLTILIVNIAVIAMIIYLKLISQTYISTIIIKDLSERRVIMSNLTIFARSLELLNYGIEAYDEVYIKQTMLEDINMYKNIVDNIENKIADWDSKTKDLYNNKLFSTWDLINSNTTKLFQENLMDVMKNFIARAVSLQLTDIKNINYLNEDLFYIYRNGLGESLKAVNSSIGIFTREQEKITDNILMIVLLLALSAIVLMILCFVAVLIPTLFSVEKSNGTVWRLFYLLPLDLVQEMRTRCEERLEMTHGIEVDTREEGQKFKSLVSRKNIKMKKKWYHILFRISLYYVISMGLFIFFYYFAYTNFGSILRIKPKLVNMSGLRTYNTNAAFFWLQELKYANTSFSYIYQTSEYRISISPEQEIKDAIEGLLFAEDSLVFEDLSHTGKTSEHDDYIWKSECFDGNCMILAKGLHAGILNFVNEVNDLENQILLGKNPDLKNILMKKNELAYGEKVLFDMYEEYMTNTINYYISTVIWVTSAYCFIVTLTFFIVYIPIINSVKDEITKVWKLGRLIPIEHRNKIMNAFKQASGKK
ncbi:hypothetical protein SteCoe_19171 [Stentor coeruleus]|uniref:TmcB/TmcC TPR repeats domain-containing protein n=1 Tax=Stentor coeruleus TaxID=5963 RepID=A0A1R2BV09_9CILI|nr:hypothetical protein SteCoe_19171 [Stentor coeruleus]